MIARAAAWLAGPTAGVWAVGAGAVLFGVVVGAWRLEAAQRDAADLRAAASEMRLVVANAALADREAVIGALDRQAEATRALRDELEPTRRVIHAAPRSTACMASPVIRAGLDSLRAARAAADPTRPRAVAGAAGMPAAPAGAGDRTGR